MACSAIGTRLRDFSSCPLIPPYGALFILGAARGLLVPAQFRNLRGYQDGFLLAAFGFRPGLRDHVQQLAMEAAVGRDDPPGGEAERRTVHIGNFATRLVYQQRT